MAIVLVVWGYSEAAGNKINLSYDCLKASVWDGLPVASVPMEVISVRASVMFSLLHAARHIQGNPRPLMAIVADIQKRPTLLITNGCWRMTSDRQGQQSAAPRRRWEGRFSSPKERDLFHVRWQASVALCIDLCCP